MSADCKTVPHADAFELGRHDHGLIAGEFAVSRLTAAAQGAQTILALLQRHYLDEELLSDDRLTFGPGVQMGLIAAAACCIERLQTALEGQGPGVAHVPCDTPAYEALEAARWQALLAAGKEGGAV